MNTEKALWCNFGLSGILPKEDAGLIPDKAEKKGGITGFEMLGH